METVHKRWTVIDQEIFTVEKVSPANGLPDPRGSLSTVISPEVISEINEDIEEATCCAAEKKHSPYKMYSSSERSQIGKYASQHGATD